MEELIFNNPLSCCSQKWIAPCKTKGCCTNKNAKKLNAQFSGILDEFTVPKELIPLIAQELHATIIDLNKESIQNEARQKRRLTEIDQKLKRLKRRFVLEEEITREEHNEFAQILQDEKQEILEDLDNTTLKSSNLQEDIFKAVQIAANLPIYWENGDFGTKQKLQRMVFPDGMTYDKKEDTVRTPRINEVIRQSSELSRLFTPKRQLRSGYARPKSSLVGPIGGTSNFSPHFRPKWLILDLHFISNFVQEIELYGKLFSQKER